MLTDTERLIEAVEYAVDSGCEWWEAFDSIKDARSTLKKARRDRPGENEMVCLLSALDECYDFFEICTLSEAYKFCLDKLLRNLDD
jgi:hypothetical protein